MDEFDKEAFDQLVNEVSELTHGTMSDPLTRDEVEGVVLATLRRLRDDNESFAVLI